MTRAVVFAYSEVGVRCLSVLHAQGVEVPLLLTHADDAQENPWFASVRDLGEAYGLRVETPEDPNTPEWVAAGRACAPDFLFSFYYRHMLKGDWLAVPRLGALNVHGSLLPKYRGRAPVHWAIIHGERETGASLHYMVDQPDAGALVDQERVPIGENDTALDVSLAVAAAAEVLLRRALPSLIAGTAASMPLDLRKVRISAGAAPTTDASTGAAGPGPCTISCARSRRPFRAPLPRSAGVGSRFGRRASMPSPRGIRRRRRVCMRRTARGSPTAPTAGACGSCNWRSTASWSRRARRRRRSRASRSLCIERHGFEVIQ